MCFRAMRSHLEPMQKVVRMLRTHEELLLNWFRAKGEISSGAVEGLNNKIRALQSRAFGYHDEEYLRLKILTCMLPKL